jgi:hypothetical protein
MSFNTTDTLIIIGKMQCNDIVDIIHTILTENNFSLDYSELTYYWLEDIETNEEFDAESIEVNTSEEAREVFERIKKHRTGGCIDYKMPLSRHIALIAFKSLDDYTIEVVKFYVQDYVYIQERELYDKVFAEIEERVKVIEIIQGNDNIKNWGEIPLIEKVISGNIDKEHIYNKLEK